MLINFTWKLWKTAQKPAAWKGRLVYRKTQSSNRAANRLKQEAINCYFHVLHLLLKHPYDLKLDQLDSNLLNQTQESKNFLLIHLHKRRNELIGKVKLILHGFQNSPTSSFRGAGVSDKPCLQDNIHRPLRILYMMVSPLKDCFPKPFFTTKMSKFFLLWHSNYLKMDHPPVIV